jgi:hypothetical protein
VTIRVTSEQWNGREALRLGNGVFEVVTLIGGGHLSELGLLSRSERSPNCLWTPPWPTADPHTSSGTGLAASLSGGNIDDPVSRFLASFTGHALCLDLFGPPSPQESALGVALHGEAAVRRWSFEPTPMGCVGRVELPVAQLSFERRLSLAPSSAVLFIEERVENRGAHSREIHWVQHLTLGPPFLAANESFVNASVDRGLTWPLGYEGHEVLRDNAPFNWPDAPTLDGGTADLRIPFARSGTGFVAAARVAPHRDFAFVTALNFRLGLALVYGFRRRDFPWVAIWEESCARTSAPWNGTTRARGMEFGTTPMPVGREAMQVMGTILDTPSTRTVAPRGVAHARYFAALTTVPTSWRAITDVQATSDGLRLSADTGDSFVAISIEGLLEFLEENAEP